ncbi:hypothetical protein COW36_05065 [bacterium (Candidatus Blackallbacteria) CG17_big_fil_post_rev_8_21_14_2_50_48_46]|uniref:N-acetyltransferase domain-containing protein n=1 Tax=bacterium (Candidatus Blackallbacteria) CG17_big_fil_post_rev_8_21_14_2_50_48_46 TaxID=2014261 RepID=A0A2M7G998_9BACT|nr:MAG: hypothetical protein COW64_03880 [bacterium (Candidatus Blackallbacteria) CG18_big_fil_WC_8_21_14_2_50_49_26]PIW18667.1 MAG: hypothetical protein COW36_05065 [bacterium (Candidatus Blackallbacteria) CG17_big_fil_post_rev_8_21_14_2_50_48_46]PIW46347.1 MAG: hypothetical protein COW20_15615 [bacterium (Candidatus Blackallbacteria) CG13_big_fil_rev_8_21_14_2_50_49_14]
MQIVPLDLNDPRMEAFFELPWQIYPEKHAWIPPSREQVRAELSTENLFFRHGQAQAFLALDGERVVGRILASLDHQLKDKRVGHFGYFEAYNRPDVAQALLNAAMDWVSVQGGKDTLHGPVDLHIFNRYRVQTAGFETSPFLGEPRSPEYYPALLESAGLMPVARWNSWDIGEMQLRGMYQYLQGQIEKIRAQRPASYRLQTFRPDALEEELRLSHQIAMEVFSENYGYTVLDFEEFQQAFSGIAGLMQIHPDLFGLFYHEQDVIGLGYAYLDYAAYFQALKGAPVNPLEMLEQQPERLVLHTFGIQPTHRHSELAYDMFYYGLKHGFARGVKSGIGALAKEGRTIYDQFGPPTRSYAVYARQV